MARPKLYRFIVTVTGRTGFPLDMLRYDGLYPQREADSGAIRRSLDLFLVPEPVTIQLTGIHLGDWQPSVDRWQSSHGWHVAAIERRDEVRP